MNSAAFPKAVSSPPRPVCTACPVPEGCWRTGRGRKGCLLTAQGAGLLSKAALKANSLCALSASGHNPHSHPTSPLLLPTQQRQKMGGTASAAGQCPQRIPQPFPSSFPSTARLDALTAQPYPASLQLTVFPCSGIPNGNFGLWARPSPAGTSSPGEARVPLARRRTPASQQYTPLWMQLQVFSLHFWFTRLILGESWGMDWRGADARHVHPTASTDKRWRGWLYANACLAPTVIT